MPTSYTFGRDRAGIRKRLIEFYKVPEVRLRIGGFADLLTDESQDQWALPSNHVILSREFPGGVHLDPVPGIALTAESGTIGLDEIRPSLLAFTVDGVPQFYLAKDQGAESIPAGWPGGVDLLISSERRGPPTFPALRSIRHLQLRAARKGKKVRDLSALADAASIERVTFTGFNGSIDLAAWSGVKALGDFSFTLSTWTVVDARRSSVPLARSRIQKPSPIMLDMSIAEFREQFLEVARAFDPTFRPAGDLLARLKIDKWEEEDHGNGPQSGGTVKGRFGDDRCGFNVDSQWWHDGSYISPGTRPYEDHFRAEAYGLPAGWKLRFDAEAEAPVEMAGDAFGVLSAAEVLQSMASRHRGN